MLQLIHTGLSSGSNLILSSFISRITGDLFSQILDQTRTWQEKIKSSVHNRKFSLKHGPSSSSSPPLPSPNSPTAFLPLCNWSLQPKTASQPALLLLFKQTARRPPSAPADGWRTQMNKTETPSSLSASRWALYVQEMHMNKLSRFYTEIQEILIWKHTHTHTLLRRNVEMTAKVMQGSACSGCEDVRCWMDLLLWASSDLFTKLELQTWSFVRAWLSDCCYTNDWSGKDLSETIVTQTCCRPTEQFIRLICQLLRFNFFEVYRNPNLRPKESSEYHYHDVTQRHVLMKSGCYDPNQHYGRGTNGAGIEPRERTPARWQM